MVIMIIRSTSRMQVTESPIRIGCTIMPAFYLSSLIPQLTLLLCDAGMVPCNPLFTDSGEVLPIGRTRGILGGERKEGLHFCLSVPGSVSPARVDSGLHFPAPLDTPRAPSPCPCRGTRAYHQPRPGEGLPHPRGHVLWGIRATPRTSLGM